MMPKQSANSLEAALGKAVKAYLGLHRNAARLPDLYEVFRYWHPAVTPDLLDTIIREVLALETDMDLNLRPEWNAGVGRLFFAGQLVKDFKRPAPNQRRLLGEFQRLEWPDQVRNPFLRDRISVDSAVETLRNAAEALNDDHLTERLLRFGTRDNGSYVYWKNVRQSA